MIRVAYIAGEPNPSRAAHLDAIARSPELELTVVYAAQTVHRRTWTIHHEHAAVYLRGWSLPSTRLLHHDYPLTWGIVPFLRSGRFDVLVIGGWSLFATQWALVWARLTRTPYLLISENHDREPRPAWIRRLRRVVLPAVVRPAAGQLVTGTLAREHVVRHGARPETITIFPNTVDVRGFAGTVDALRDDLPALRDRFGVADGAVVVFCAARTVPMKAVDRFVDATIRAARLAATPIHLLHAGAGDVGALRRECARAGLAATFLGELQGDALAGAYAAADVFVLLSRRETWGIVVNEAMAAALPVVAAEGVGAAADLVRSGENGFTVATVADAASAIAALADERDRRVRFGRRSRELIEPWGYEPSVETFVAAVRRALT